MAKKPVITDTEAKLLPRISLFFFRHKLFTLCLWLVLLVFGIASYTTFMKRAGFPAAQAPVSFVSGAYLVNDAKKVDTEVAKPLSETVLQRKDVKSVTATTDANTFQVFIQYKDGTDTKSVSKALEQKVTSERLLPKDTKAVFQALDIGGYNISGDSYDGLIAFYGGTGNTEELANQAKVFAQHLKDKRLSLVSKVDLVDPFKVGINPLTGQTQKTQTHFDRYGNREDGKTVFREDVVVAVKAAKNADTVKFYKQLKSALDEINKNGKFAGYTATLTAGVGPTIELQISEMQRALLEGLTAVLVIGSILIALRASLMTILSMVSVIAIALGVLFLIGYTLNVLTLFALILGLSLIVDDTIIMVEAIDVERKRQKDATRTVKAATTKISLAMLAATSTAILGFAPLLFVSGILGSFIRAIPVTIITSLLVSLFVALTIIPFIARFFVLYKGHIGPQVKDPLPVRMQEAFAHRLTAPLRWAKQSRKRLWTLGSAAIIFAFAFIISGVMMFKYVTFNIFPNSKDADGMSLNIAFPAGTTLPQAEATADRINAVVANRLGDNFKQGSYYSQATASSAQMFIDLKPYGEREVKAPQLVKSLENDFRSFQGANVKVSQIDVGPPAGTLNVRVQTNDRANAMKLAADIATFLNGRTLTRPDGSTARITHALVMNPDGYQRQNNKEYIEVQAGFDGTDTSTLVTLGQDAVEKEFTAAKLKAYNLNKDNLVFDFGFESDNQESFKSMVLAFPVLLIIIYLLLSLQFRSLLQPLLIFMAIPFSIFGVTGGLNLTDNPFSFFTLLGCFALIGLSIKNTILLTDYANQARRAGLGRVDAISSALEERFRPLLATSVTAIVSLIPLALMSPFWEALAYTLIFGLLSSTFLVLTAFPYFYLGAEYLRMKVSRLGFLKWVALNVAIAVLAAKLVAASAIVVAVLLLNIGWIVFCKVRASRLAR